MRRARVLVLVAAVCFATTGTAQALGPDASSATVGAARIAVGALLLVAVERVAVERADGERTGPIGARRSAGGRSGLSPRAAVVVAGVGVACYQLCFFAGVRSAGVAVGTVVALGSAPVFAGVLVWLVDRVRPTGAWLAATVISMLGVGLLTVARTDGAGPASPTGVALSAGAGAAYALFTVASKQVLTGGASPTVVMSRAFGLGAVLLSPVLVLGGSGWLATPSGVATALWLGAVPTALAYVLFARGLRSLPAEEVATLTLAEPVTAALLGVAVLGERPPPLAIAGVVAILTGLVVLARR
ncbi:MAG: EamA family transporter [Actinomycetota bacterium]|nr:EamA family transporter [Actinomycetota bacterium]